MRRLRPWSTMVLSLVSAAPGEAWAQTSAAAPAAALFQRGLDDMLAGHYETACPAIAESQRLDPRPGTLFTLAECEAKSGKLASALAHYEDYLALVDRLPPRQRALQQERVRLSEAARGDLRPQVPRLLLRLSPGAPSGTSVKVDGLELGTAALGVPLPVDPGEHVVVTRAPGRGPSIRKIAVAVAEHREEVLQIAAEQAGTPRGERLGLAPDAHPSSSQISLTEPPESQLVSAPTSRRGLWPAMIAAGGLALGAAGGAALWVAHDKADQIQNARDRAFDDDALDYPTWNTAGLVLLGTGALAVAVAAYLWWR